PSALAEIKLALPSRRGPEILARSPVLPQLVVHFPFFGVLQDLVGFIEFLEFLFRVGRFVDVRMVFARKLAVCPLHIVLAGIPLNSEYLVVVPVFNSHKVLSYSFNNAIRRYQQQRGRNPLYLVKTTTQGKAVDQETPPVPNFTCLPH